MNPADSMRARHVFSLGPVLSTSGLLSTWLSNFKGGAGFRSTYSLQRGKRTIFIAELQFSYFKNTNIFATYVSESAGYYKRSFGYYGQAGCMRVFKDGDGDPLMDGGLYVQGKIYDTHKVRDNYQLGLLLGKSFPVKLFKIPVWYVFRMNIPLVDYTESFRYERAFSTEIYLWQFFLSAEIQLTRNK